MSGFYLVSRAFFFSILLLGVSACGEAEQKQQANNAATGKPAPNAASEKPRIALVMKTLTNPFFVSMEKGARDAEKEFGIELIVRTAAEETSIAQQIDIVERIRRNKEAAAIVIAPGDSTQLIPVLKKAQDEGIVIVNIDNRLDPEFSEKHGLRNVPFISVDNEQGAYLSAKHIFAALSAPTQVAILEGIPTAKNAQARKAGAERAIAEIPHATLVASQSAHWKIDEAYDVSRDLFAKHPDIGAVFCANDMMALGLIRFLGETGRDDVKVAAFDALDEAKSAIRRGTLVVSIDQQPARQGYLGVTYALDMLNGKEKPAETIIDVMVVDRGNVN
ncbi:MAG: substrate-binding domain-containing protein [Magnetospiraceae bacterium]